MQTAVLENSQTALDQNEYERSYVDLIEKYNAIKAEYDMISEVSPAAEQKKISHPNSSMTFFSKGFKDVGSFWKLIYKNNKIDKKIEAFMRLTGGFQKEGVSKPRGSLIYR